MITGKTIFITRGAGFLGRPRAERRPHRLARRSEYDLRLVARLRGCRLADRQIIVPCQADHALDDQVCGQYNAAIVQPMTEALGRVDTNMIVPYTPELTIDADEAEGDRVEQGFPARPRAA